MSKAQQLRNKIANLEIQLKDAKIQLAEMQQKCKHNWGPVGFSPGWSFNSNFDRDADQWNRTCAECGLVQYTTHKKKVKSAGKWPGTYVEAEEPAW